MNTPSRGTGIKAPPRGAAIKAKHQRLILALLAVVAIVGAALLAMSALKDQASYFYTPSDAKRDHVEPGRAVRLGGMVQKGSIKRHADGVTIDFLVTDNAETVPVRFKGIVPDLFKEGSGVVAEGKFQADQSFVADNILAKHDERYMPPQIAGEMHKTESLEKMIAEAGLAALWLAAALAALQLVLGAMAVSSDRTDLLATVRPIAMVQAVLTVIAFATLIWLFVTVDLSVALVAANDASTKPLLYKFAGTWGNHEGSMLMWVTILAVAGGAVAIFERRLNERTLIATLAAQAAIGLGFYAFLLFASNPFARLNPAPAEGQGLNPLLQDPGLAFHPPTLYLGYVGLSVAFSFAVGALVTRDVGAAFARAMRPWVLGAWILLTLGITAGSYWAYYELGWGGWWFWDPVENASLMPWLAATALLHSVTVLATRDGLRAWTVMLAVVAFSMSMVGTFLVRSGILTSVHAFAVDPRRGSFILALLAIYIGGALALFALRVGTVREGSRFDAVSREGALVINNLLLSAILGIVLVGTLYPLMAEAVTGEKLSVGPPYFNAAAGPLALILIAAMAAGPMMKWRRDDLKVMTARMAVPALISALALLAVVLLAPPIGILPLLGLVVAAGVALASLAPLWRRNLRRTPLYIWGMVVAHLGIAVSLAGMASESAFTKETLVATRVGETHAVGPYAVRLTDVEPVAGANYTAVEATVEAQRGAAPAFILKPQTRMFASPQTETNESAIRTVWDGQLYVVVGKPDEQGRWQLRLWWKPFVTLIWAGGAMVAFGGFLALIGRVRRGMRHAPAREFI